MSAFEEARRLLEDRDVGGALELFRRAEALGHNPDECAAQRWFCHMLLGRFEDAWRESDAIAAHGASDPHRWWDGRPITRGALMIRCLHGLGDTIQYIRFAKPMREIAARVIVSAHPSMVSLLRCADGVDEAIGWGDDGGEPAFDQQVEVVELPRIFRVTEGSIPARVPYFRVDSGANPRGGGGFRVGLCWRSSEWDVRRSIAFEELAPLRAVEGVEFGTLQFGEEAIGERLADESKPVLNTAREIAKLDLVITVDTMVAHLAGALGKPVWVLLPFCADWRWMLDRETSPWYPTARLFRQERPGEWGPVITSAAAALKRCINIGS